MILLGPGNSNFSYYVFLFVCATSTKYKKKVKLTLSENGWVPCTGGLLRLLTHLLAAQVTVDAPTLTLRNMFYLKQHICT